MSAASTISGRYAFLVIELKPQSSQHEGPNNGKWQESESVVCKGFSSQVRYNTRMMVLLTPSSSNRLHLYGGEPAMTQSTRGRSGPDNPGWRGDEARSETKRARAHRLYPDLGDCEECGKPATDRHHKDGNTGNNDRLNLAFLCRRCHMVVDGRLASLAALASQPKTKSPARPCINCGRMAKPLRKGRCGACNEYLRKRGVERPEGCRQGIPCHRQVTRELAGRRAARRRIETEQAKGIVRLF